MKKILILLGLVLVLASVVAYNHNSHKVQYSAGRGCSSSHYGVCGCQNGRAKCCDGTLSPSCRCFKDDIKGFGM